MAANFKFRIANRRAHFQAFLAAAILGATASTLMAGSRASANYTIVADSQDGGGTQASSANYTSQGSLGGVGALATVASPSETMKSGFVGQLYQVTGLQLAPTFSDNGTTQQLSATQTLDDGTMLALIGGSESWSVTAGQLPAGLTLNPTTGVVSGSPTGSGPYSFTIQVTDGLGDTADQTFSGTSPGSPVASTDTPTMPPWALGLLAVFLYAVAGRFLTKQAKIVACLLSSLLTTCVGQIARQIASES